MAAAVQTAPQHLGGVMGHSYGQYDAYSNGVSMLEDSDDDHDPHNQHGMDGEEMDYYDDHEYHHQQQQHLHHQVYHHEDDDADIDQDDMYSDDSSDESIVPDENIDFSLIYARHTFLATVEGQASVVKGDSLLLLDDANSYWWLVRVLKTEDVGYIPAENVETPYERLARLNKHRNIDIAASTEAERNVGLSPTKKLKTFIGWKTRNSAQSEYESDDPEERVGRRVIFAPPTYVDHPGVTWSSDEEDDMVTDNESMDVHDVDDEIGDEHAVNELGYEAEPDDGVEWAQDAVEAMRSGSGPGAGAPQYTEEDEIDMRVHAETPPPEESDAGVGGGPAATAAAAGVAGAVLGGAAAGVAGAVIGGAAAAQHLGGAGPQQHPPAPNRSPSPAAQKDALARTNPTPPPHRAVRSASTDIEPSPEPFSREDIEATPPPASSTGHMSRASDRGLDRTGDTPSPVTHMHPSTHSTPTQNAGSTETHPTTVSATSTTARTHRTSITSIQAQSPPGTVRSPRQQPGRIPMWYRDGLDVSRLATLVSLRADEARRSSPRPVRKPIDEVQHTLYGDKIELNSLHPDIRAGYVHLQAKMDAFDREVDDILGSLIAAH